MNLSKQGDHILRRSEVELDDGVNAIFDWHSRSIMVKDVLIEIVEYLLVSRPLLLPKKADRAF